MLLETVAHAALHNMHLLKLMTGCKQESMPCHGGLSLQQNYKFMPAIHTIGVGHAYRANHDYNVHAGLRSCN